VKAEPIDTGSYGEEMTVNTQKRSVWHRVRPIFTLRFLKSFSHILVDAAILFGLIFSMIVSPFTIVAFVAWIEFQIYNDGPSQESPRQVGQWAYLVSIALLVISAGILTLKYRIASSTELENEITEVKKHLGNLERMKTARSVPNEELEDSRHQSKRS
jgi:hypothetical protein